MNSTQQTTQSCIHSKGQSKKKKKKKYIELTETWIPTIDLSFHTQCITYWN